MINIKRQTKIIATLGPGTNEVQNIKNLIKSGLNVARLNMSHGDHVEHGNRINNLRQAIKETGSHTGVLIDLSGPKIRTGDLESDTIELIPGKSIVLTTREVVGTCKELTIRYKNFEKEVKVGGFVMLDDGRRKLQIQSIKGQDVTCKIIIGGIIKPRRGVNLPGAYLSISSVTKKDEEDLKFAIKHKADYVALSFVRTSEDVKHLRSLFPKNFKPLIISKIETEEALDNIDSILTESDGIMVARGDLAIEVPREQVPIIQKMLIKKATEKQKISIVATQMLETMINSPVPTRAEVSDIANAIMDGCDAVMLSEETAMGKYPSEAVAMMSGVAMATDPHGPTRESVVDADNLRDPIKKHAVLLAEDINAGAIVVLTETGYTPLKISTYKGRRPIIALMQSEGVASKMAMVRGVWPIVTQMPNNIEELRALVRDTVKTNHIVKKGESVVVVTGTIFGIAGESNTIFFETL